MCTRGASEAPSASGASSSKKRSAREAELPVADALWARISKQNGTRVRVCAAGVALATARAADVGSRAAAVDDDVAVVEKWYRRIHAASSANLQVLNQSFRSQVDNALLDTEKLLVRAQSRRNVPRIIGEVRTRTANGVRAHSG